MTAGTGIGSAGAQDGRDILAFGEITQTLIVAGVEFAVPSLDVTVNEALPTKSRAGI